MKRKIRLINNYPEINFEGFAYRPGFQNLNSHSFSKTLQTSFKSGDFVSVKSASSGIGVKKDGTIECWIRTQ